MNLQRHSEGLFLSKYVIRSISAVCEELEVGVGHTCQTVLQSSRGGEVSLHVLRFFAKGLGDVLSASLDYGG